jgi:hypothetical protein
VIGLINLGLPGKVNASLNYIIKNAKGESVYFENEIVSVETQTEFVKEIDISKLELGKYTLIIDLAYEGQEGPAYSEDNFVIIKQEPFLSKNKNLIIIIIIALLLILFFGLKSLINLRNKTRK